MEEINEIFNELKNIQNDLVGILISTIITSVTSIITLLVNSILQLYLNDKQYKSTQYEIMRNNYPKIRSWLSELEYCYHIIENNKLYGNNFTIKEFLNVDWANYRQNLSTEEIQSIDEYQENIIKAIETFKEINDFFKSNNLPTSSKKVQTAISNLQFFCVYVSNSNDNKNYPYIKDFNCKKIKNLIKILDNHYNKF